MPVLTIAKLGKPVLRRISEKGSPTELESPAMQAFIDNLVETMRVEDGVGLAAPQVSVSKQIIAVESEANPRYPDAPVLPLLILVNPVFTFMSNETQVGWEGCLSVDNLRGKVQRSSRVSVKALDRHGKPVSLDADGFLAVVLQHEVDHLNGKVFLDRMDDLSTLTHLAEFEQYWVKKETVPVT